MTFQEFLNNLYRILNHKILGESYPDFSLKFILINKQTHLDSGRSFAFIQFTKYIIYTGIFIQALSIIGIKFTVIWGGAAALLVGIGLGLQQTFNDLISGLILLVEGTVEVGDIVEINGVVGTVINIGIRTSKIKSRDGISLLIPNSKLVGDSSTNWSHTVQTTRFQIKVGVAYSSDVQFVTNLLLDSVKNHPKILNKPEPRIQFKDFGNSSLDFEIHFFSNELLGIEFVKSDVRYKIMELFRVNNIEIPFPQQDIWFKNQIK
jgi:small-conductance mechanosensitive channel